MTQTTKMIKTTSAINAIKGNGKFTARKDNLKNTSAISAGTSAFKALIPFYNNPYSNEPGKGLWRKGYERAKREWEINNPRPKKEYDYDAA